jgi:hypothetical protein
LQNDERNNAPGPFCSRRANRLMPCLHSRSPETAARFSRNEVALDVEGVVGGSKAFRDRSARQLIEDGPTGIVTFTGFTAYYGPPSRGRF